MAPTDVRGQQELRTEAAGRRDAIDPVRRLDLAEKIASTLDAVPEFSNATGLAFYYSVGSEVPTQDLIARVVEMVGRRAFLPFVLSGQLELAEWRPSDPLIQGQGLPPFQPRYRRAVPLEEIDVIVVPGLAFDRTGRRLDAGESLYEELLTRLQGMATRIGFAFGDQVVDDLSDAGIEQTVDLVVTENEVVDCR